MIAALKHCLTNNTARLGIFRTSLLALMILPQSGFTAAPNIQGSVNINVEIGDVVNYAEAADSVAQVAIGSVSEGTIGSFTSTVAVGDVINYASGNGSCAQVLLGSVGVPSCVAGDPTGVAAPPPPLPVP